MSNFMLDKDNKMLDIIKWRLRSTNTYRKIFFALGILICLAGAGLMFDGAILGETTTNVATVLGITGIGLIATSTQRRTMNNGGE
jgi:energy-converting hydrogenase Eha subunit H